MKEEKSAETTKNTRKICWQSRPADLSISDKANILAHVAVVEKLFDCFLVHVKYQLHGLMLCYDANLCNGKSLWETIRSETFAAGGQEIGCILTHLSDEKTAKWLRFSIKILGNLSRLARRQQPLFNESLLGIPVNMQVWLNINEGVNYKLNCNCNRWFDSVAAAGH